MGWRQGVGANYADSLGPARWSAATEKTSAGFTKGCGSVMRETCWGSRAVRAGGQAQPAQSLIRVLSNPIPSRPIPSPANDRRQRPTRGGRPARTEYTVRPHHVPCFPPGGWTSVSVLFRGGWVYEVGAGGCRGGRSGPLSSALEGALGGMSAVFGSPIGLVCGMMWEVWDVGCPRHRCSNLEPFEEPPCQQ